MANSDVIRFFENCIIQVKWQYKTERNNYEIPG
jgi:hypothetical protein